jgi:hypothetical protein
MMLAIAFPAGPHTDGFWRLKRRPPLRDEVATAKSVFLL